MQLSSGHFLPTSPNGHKTFSVHFPWETFLHETRLHVLNIFLSSCFVTMVTVELQKKPNVLFLFTELCGSLYRRDGVYGCPWPRPVDSVQQGEPSPRWTCLHVHSLPATRLLFEASEGACLHMDSTERDRDKMDFTWHLHKDEEVSARRRYSFTLPTMFQWSPRPLMRNTPSNISSSLTYNFGMLHHVFIIRLIFIPALSR